MKHRSIVAFVLLAATLAAVPQATQDLSELKSALGARVRSEIWHAFLSFNGRRGAVQAAPRRAQHTLASCQSAPANPGAKKSSAPARAAAQVEATADVDAARTVEAEELAMMLTPPAEVEERIEVGPGEGVKGLVLGKVLKAPTREPLPARELAMIIPPGEGADPVVSSRLEAASKAIEAGARARQAEVEARVSYVAAAFNERGVEFRKVGDVMRFQFNNSTKDGVAIPAPAVAPKGKLTKSRRPQTTTGVKAPAAVTTRQVKQLACLGSELGSAEALAATE